MDDESKAAWDEAIGEQTLEGLGAMAVACEAGLRAARFDLAHADHVQYLLDLHQIVLAELLRRTGKGR